MGYYGVGWTLIGASLGGFCGNLVSLFLHRSQYLSLGASGVVMAALGLLTIYWLPWIYGKSRPLRYAYSVVAGSALIFILAGLSPDPQVNVPAHLGGYLGGILFGAILIFIPDRFLENTEINVALTILWFAFSAAGSWRPILSPPLPYLPSRCRIRRSASHPRSCPAPPCLSMVRNYSLSGPMLKGLHDGSSRARTWRPPEGEVDKEPRMNTKGHEEGRNREPR